MKPQTKWLIFGAAALIGLVAAGSSWLSERANQLPQGLAVGNGRIEAEQIDLAAKMPGRIKQIGVREGQMVATGELLVEMDMAELLVGMDQANARTKLASQKRKEAEAIVQQRQSELQLAEHDLVRAKALTAKGHLSRAQLDQKQTARDVAYAVLGAANAAVETAQSQIAVAAAESRRIQAQIDEGRIFVPANGRVLYRLAEPGEIVGAGQPILTVLSLENIYMEIFLPAEQAGLLPIGADARIVIDALPEYAIPAKVSFVSPEAQFTPKQVETLSEREKLVFRVRVRIDPERVAERIKHVKTGLRGMAYVKLQEKTTWPDALEKRIPDELFE